MNEGVVRSFPSLGGNTARHIAPAFALADVRPTALLGHTLQIDVLGTRPVERVEPTRNALFLSGVREALDLHRVMYDGAAVALDSKESLGRAVVVPPARSPHWTARGERTWLAMLAAPLLGNAPIFKPEPLKGGGRYLAVPSDLRAATPEAHLFAHALAGLVYCTPVDDARKALLAQGYKEARIVERNQALALVAVSPDGRAITVTFRGAWHFKTLLAVLDRRQLDDGGGEPVPRGVSRYIGQVREPLNALVGELLDRYPNANVFVASSSLGGGAAMQWTDQELRSGLLTAERVARVVTIGAVPGLGKERAEELRRVLHGRLDVIVHRLDIFPWLLGLWRRHANRLTVVDGGLEKDRPPLLTRALTWLFPPVARLRTWLLAHRLTVTTRFFVQQLAKKQSLGANALGTRAQTAALVDRSPTTTKQQPLRSSSR